MADTRIILQRQALRHLKESLMFAEGWGDWFRNMDQVIEYRTHINDTISSVEHMQQRYKMFDLLVCTALVANRIEIRKDNVPATSFMSTFQDGLYRDSIRSHQHELKIIDMWIKQHKKLFA